jgi:hypothetical protein
MQNLLRTIPKLTAKREAIEGERKEDQLTKRWMKTPEIYCEHIIFSKLNTI